MIKAFALLNLWDRESENSTIIASEEDIAEAFKIWDKVSESQEFNLPPYVYNLFREVILPLYRETGIGLTRREIVKKHFQVYERILPDWQLQRQIIPMLETAGLIHQEPHPEDRRMILIYPTELRNSVDCTVG